MKNHKKRAFSYKAVQQSGYKKTVGVWLGYLPLDKMKEPLIYKGSRSGRNRTRRENGAVFLNQRKPKRRFFKGFLAITNNEKQPRTTPVGVRVGVSVGVRKTSCIAPLSVGLSKK